MTTHYWLEIWVDTERYTPVCQVMGVEPASDPRAILKLFASEQQDSPQWFEIDAYLDMLDDKYGSLAHNGVERKDISVWIKCAYDRDEECHIELDPMTMLRLGQEGIKPCISFGNGDDWEDFVEEEPLQLHRTVEIRDIGISDEQSDTAGHVEATVCFDDGSFWTANFVTFNYLRKALIKPDTDEFDAETHFFWIPQMILIEQIGKEEIESAVIKLLNQQKFEQAFARQDVTGGSDAEDGFIEVELSIIHESGLETPIEEILGISEPYIMALDNFWILKKVHIQGQPYIDYISYFLDILQDHYKALSEIGIQRKDITINWTYQYEGQCNLEFRPEVLERLGKNGINLNLYCRQAASFITRSLD